jgi:beta-phosphoglucomutase-like phosphatase (HAD superfamily)
VERSCRSTSVRSSVRRTSSTESLTRPGSYALWASSTYLPEEAVAIEDSEPGVAAAKVAGIHTVALLGTVSAERLSRADELAGLLDASLVKRLRRT